MPTKATRSSASRRSVQVVLRASRSIALVSNAGHRAEARSGTTDTLPACPTVAPATARQKSASSPDQRPDPSWAENPTIPSLTPQRRVPRAFTSARVAPAHVGDATHALAKPTAAMIRSDGAPARTVGPGMRGIIAQRDDGPQRKKPPDPVAFLGRPPVGTCGATSSPSLSANTGGPLP